MSANDTETNGFTAGETKIIMCLIKHLQGDLPSDFEAVAKELGYKDASIAKTRWGQIRRKKINNSGSGGTPATPGGEKAILTGGWIAGLLRYCSTLVLISDRGSL